MVYDTCHGGLYGAGGPMYVKMFGEECITGAPRGTFPITRNETLANGSVVTTTISANPYSTATTTTVTITHPDGTSMPAIGASTEETAAVSSAEDKEYVLRMPSQVTFNELHEKRKEGFLFDDEVSSDCAASCFYL